MKPVLEKTFGVRSYEVDFTGHVRSTAIINYLMESAGDHARLLGVAVKDLMAHGLTWVLSRTHVKILGAAHSRDQILVRTWPSMREGRFTCREFELFCADGNPFALATCSFAVLDLRTRRPVALDNRLPPYPLTPRRAIDDSFATLPRLEDADHEAVFTVGMAELDINRHANNVVYVAWALDAVPLDVVERYRLTELEVAYRAEVFHGQTVLSRSKMIRGGDSPTFLHQLVRREDGTELTRLVTRWTKAGREVDILVTND